MKFGNLAKAASSDRKVLNLYDQYLLDRDPKAEAQQIQWIQHKNEQRNRVGTWSASAAGTCQRQQQFTFLGMPKKTPTPEQLNIFFNGDYVHLRYQVAGLVAGWLTDVEVPLSFRTVRGTADGLLVWGEVLEIKSINDRGFSYVSEFGIKAEHKRQATAYMMATGTTRTRFIYENKNTNVNLELPYDLDPEMVSDINTEWEALNSYSMRRELVPMLEDCKAHTGFAWNYCPYSDQCEEAKWPSPPLRIVRSGSE